MSKPESTFLFNNPMFNAFSPMPVKSGADVPRVSDPPMTAKKPVFTREELEAHMQANSNRYVRCEVRKATFSREQCQRYQLMVDVSGDVSQEELRARANPCRNCEHHDKNLVLGVSPRGRKGRPTKEEMESRQDYNGVVDKLKSKRLSEIPTEVAPVLENEGVSNYNPFED